MILLSLMPRFSIETIQAAERYGAALGLGVLVFFGVSIAALYRLHYGRRPAGRNSHFVFVDGFSFCLLCCGRRCDWPLDSWQQNRSLADDRPYGAGSPYRCRGDGPSAFRFRDHGRCLDLGNGRDCSFHLSQTATCDRSAHSFHAEWTDRNATVLYTGIGLIQYLPGKKDGPRNFRGPSPFCGGGKNSIFVAPLRPGTNIELRPKR